MILKQNSHNITKVGDGYDSCCDVYTRELASERGDLDDVISEDRDILSAIGLSDRSQLDRIRELSR